jgi:hypothetical protein
LNDDEDDERKSSMNLTIIVERSIQNPELTRIHVNRILSYSTAETFYRPFDRDTSKKFMEKLGNTGNEIVLMLSKIEGVSFITIRPYEVEIAIGRAFDLAKIVEDIALGLKDILAPDLTHMIDGDPSTVYKKIVFFTPIPSEKPFKHSFIKYVFVSLYLEIKAILKRLPKRIKR